MVDEATAKYLVGLGMKLATGTTIKPDSEPEDVYYLQYPNGAIERKVADPEPRDHNILFVEDMVAFAINHKSDLDSMSIWCSRTGITLILNESTRRDHVRLPLEKSRQISTLELWNNSTIWLDQTSLVRILRATFSECLPGQVIPAFRRLKFRVNSSGEKVLEHGRSSIGKTLEAELTGESALPEELVFHVPMFNGSNLSIWSHIRCIVDADPHAEKIAIIPQAGQCEGAWLRSESEIAKLIKERIGEESGIHVYCGEP